jgi:hypothetical protein
MAKITKRKDPVGWRIHIDGCPTRLLISKGDAPRYREPQMYNLVAEYEGDEWPRFVFEANGVGAIMERLEMIYGEIA